MSELRKRDFAQAISSDGVDEIDRAPRREFPRGQPERR